MRFDIPLDFHFFRRARLTDTGWRKSQGCWMA